MSNAGYATTSFDYFLSHGFSSINLLHDEWTVNKQELHAFVRSGDYFATLATTLDTISRELTENGYAETYLLQKIIDDLEYLQQRYKIAPKD